MTVEVTDSRERYATDGTSTTFAIGFYFLANSHLQVVHTDSAGAETILPLTTGYSVTGAGDENGGSITTTTTYPSGGYITIVRDVPITQLTDYVSQDAFPAESHEAALDKLTMIVQQQDERLSRALSFPVSDPITRAQATFPVSEDRLDRFVVFDSTTGLPEMSTVTQTQVASAVAAAYAAGSTADAVTFLQAGTGATSRSTQSKLREVISVKDFGAVGDGAADDTVAIQAAVTQAGVEAGVVFVPSGTYISTTIDVPSNVTIYGEGPGLSIIKRKAAHTAPILRALGAELARLRNITISDLTVEGLEVFGTADLSQATGHGIWIAYADNVLLENVRSTGHNHNGIHLTSVSKSLVKNCEADTNWIGIYWSGFWTGSTAILSERCEVSHCRIHSNANDGFDFDFGVDGGSITGSHLYANDADADGDGGAIVVASDVLAFPCRNITVANNHVLDAPISFAGTQGFVCTGNFVANTAHNTTAGQTQFGHGIEVFRKTGQAACIDGVITGNEVANTGKHGIAVINWTASGTQDDILIADNIVKNCGSTTANTNDAIYVDAYSRKVVVSNNRIVCAVAGRTRYAVNLVSGATGALLGGVFDAGVTGTINNAAAGFAVRYTPQGAAREEILTDLYIGSDGAAARDVFVKGNNGGRVRMQFSTAFGVDIGATDNSGSGTIRGHNGSWLEMLAWDLNRNVQAGGGALATSATNGFFYVPTCAGTPTGVPTTKTGFAPVVVNTTNNKLYFYSGGAWRDAGP